MNEFLGSAGMMPHGYCLLWKPWLVVLHATADVLIFASYFVIPIAIISFLRQRPDIRFGSIGVLFASFILLCGLTHLFGLATLWVPIYEIEGFVKIATAAVSATTAVVLFVLMPKLVALPSPTQLQQVNAELEAEVAAHRETLEELQRIRAGLEREVEERTRALTESNERLSVVTRETVHRAKNLLTVVQSIARQSGKFASTKDELVDALQGRLASLANALSSVNETGHDGADLGEMVESQLEHYRDTYQGRIAIEGSPLRVRAEAAQQIGLAIHELATNSVKYGALSGADGRISIEWHEEPDPGGGRFRLSWAEIGSSPAGSDRPKAMKGRGFGSQLLNRAVPMQLRGDAWAESGDGFYRYELTAPLAELRPRIRPVPSEGFTEAYG